MLKLLGTARCDEHARTAGIGDGRSAKPSPSSSIAEAVLNRSSHVQSGWAVSSVFLAELCIKGDHRDKDILLAFGDVYQWCPAEHQMDWNPRNPVVIHCEQRLGSPRSAGACHAV
jgi:hypothetical protein